MLFRYGLLRDLSAAVTCGVAEEQQTLHLECAKGSNISKVSRSVQRQSSKISTADIPFDLTPH